MDCCNEIKLKKIRIEKSKYCILVHPIRLRKEKAVKSIFSNRFKMGLLKNGKIQDWDDAEEARKYSICSLKTL